MKIQKYRSIANSTKYNWIIFQMVNCVYSYDKNGLYGWQLNSFHANVNMMMRTRKMNVIKVLKYVPLKYDHCQIH